MADEVKQDQTTSQGGAEKPAPKVTSARPGLKTPAAEPIESGTLWMSRRNFMSRAGWAAFFSFFGTMLIGSVRYMFPRVLFEPSTVFKAGFPTDYNINSVSTQWIKEYRTWIVRTDQGFFAIFAQCTHLGCTPRWLDAEGKFKCPCHGSGFTMEGINFEGPAPRPLERCQITLAEDGQLQVDTNIRFREELGQWRQHEAFLTYS